MLDERGAKLMGLLLTPGPPVPFQQVVRTLKSWRNGCVQVDMMHVESPDRQGLAEWFYDRGLVRRVSTLEGLMAGNPDHSGRSDESLIGLSFAQAFSTPGGGDGLILVYATGARSILCPVTTLS